METMAIYNSLSTPPNDALKPIGFGNLKGKSDINPQWRYEAITNQFGSCGVGWKYTIDSYWTQPIQQTGETMVYVMISFYFRNGDQWSEPIPAYGGDYLIKKDKNGIHGNDEAMKMAITDALGTAMKMIGVAADVYRGLIANGASDSKYARRDYAAQSAPQPRQAAPMAQSLPSVPTEQENAQMAAQVQNKAQQVAKSFDARKTELDVMPLAQLEQVGQQTLSAMQSAGVPVSDDLARDLAAGKSNAIAHAEKKLAEAGAQNETASNGGGGKSAQNQDAATTDSAPKKEYNAVKHFRREVEKIVNQYREGKLSYDEANAQLEKLFQEMLEANRDENIKAALMAEYPNAVMALYLTYTEKENSTAPPEA